jgi:hypothetical protein
MVGAGAWVKPDGLNACCDSIETTGFSTPVGEARASRNPPEAMILNLALEYFRSSLLTKRRTAAIS